MSEYINVSGTIFKGIPNGRINIICGEPSTGKSHIEEFFRRTAIEYNRKNREKKLKRILNEEM